MDTFDAIVVGSGITGGWAAKELTEAGLKVLMLERGPSIEHGKDYHTEMKRPWEMPFRGKGDPELYASDFPVQRHNRHFNEYTQAHFCNDRENPYSVPDGQSFNWWRSYNLGGRSLTWGRQSYRWSDYDFGANKRDGHGTDWPIRYAELAPWYDKVESFIGVSGAAEHLPQLPDGQFLPAMDMNAVEQHARAKILEQWPDRVVTPGRVANLTKPLPGRGQCQYRMLCARGCSFGAYFSTQSSTLPAARATGNLTLITDSLVDSLEYDAATNRVSGVRVRNIRDGSSTVYRSKIVFLNAGSFNSVHLLLRSRSEAFPNGLANGSGVLGRYIMDHATTLGAVALMPGFEDRTSFGNRPNGIIVPRFRNLDQQDGEGFVRGYSFQGGAIQSNWTRGMREPGIGEGLKQHLRTPGGWRMVLVSFAESLPRAENRLMLDDSRTDAFGIPLLNIDFRHGDNERAALSDATAQASAMLAAAGGQVLFGSSEPGVGGSAIHEVGGARMGYDPASSVLNRWSQAHDVPNLFVTDGAQMASSACQNPSLTYMALTARACNAAVTMLKEGRFNIASS